MSGIILKNIGKGPEPEDSIKLETCKRNRIPNLNFNTIPRWEVMINAGIEQQYGSTVTFKGNPTAIYNCHGFTFASRRTAVNPEHVRNILRDDSYIQIMDENLVLAGDIVLYLSNDGKGDIQHTGMVIHIDKLTNPWCKWVLSKWGKYKEVIHPLQYCAYTDCVFEFWRNNHGYTEE